MKKLKNKQELKEIVNNRFDTSGKRLPDRTIIKNLYTDETVEEITIDSLLYDPETKEPIPWVSDQYERVNGRVEENPKFPGNFILKFQERLKKPSTTSTTNSESK